MRADRSASLDGARITVAALALWCAAAVHAQDQQAPALSFAALEAAGVRVGEVRVRAEDIFDTADARENNWFFRLANTLHLQTRPQVIEQQLLFKRGEPVSVRLIEETERLLRSNRYLHDVSFVPTRVHDGVVDIEVVTRDAWSLDVGGSATRTGGSNSGGLRLAEYNLLGTGTSVTLGRSKNVDRTSTVFSFGNRRAFGTWADLSLSHAVNSDGKRDEVGLVRPFYALDSRWAAGISAVKDNRINSVYQRGRIVSQYRQRQDQGDAFIAWSPGLVDGWVKRWSLGVSVRDDSYLPEPGLTPPARLPTDRTLRSPYLRWELIEDRFDRELNRNLIGRPEFFSLGLATSVQLGYAAQAFGSSVNALLYSASISRGFEPLDGHTLIVSAKLSGEYVDQSVQRQRLNVQAQVYLPQSPRWLFYAAGSVDALTRPDPSEALVLGGEEELRGYPLRYQSGNRRALFTVEERFYTDWYVWRLFRVGGAGFLDGGRAWGGSAATSDHPDWLANAGVGLRIVNARSAFSNVLHVDVAAPLTNATDVKKLQFSVKTKTSF